MEIESRKHSDWEKRRWLRTHIGKQKKIVYTFKQSH